MIELHIQKKRPKGRFFKGLGTSLDFSGCPKSHNLERETGHSPVIYPLEVLEVWPTSAIPMDKILDYFEGGVTSRYYPRRSTSPSQALKLILHPHRRMPPSALGVPQKWLSLMKLPVPLTQSRDLPLGCRMTNLQPLGKARIGQQHQPVAVHGRFPNKQAIGCEVLQQVIIQPLRARPIKQIELPDQCST